MGSTKAQLTLASFVPGWKPFVRMSMNDFGISCSSKKLSFIPAYPHHSIEACPAFRAFFHGCWFHRQFQRFGSICLSRHALSLPIVQKGYH